MGAGPDGGRRRCRRCGEHLHVADGADRRAVAGAHAGRAHDPDVGAEPAGQIVQQVLRARHRAGQRVADPHRDRRRRRFAFLHHVEMGVERRDLVDLGLRELHLGGERGEMRAGNVAVPVLDQVQVLDQQIAPPRPVAEQRAHLVERLRIDLAALRRARRSAASASSRFGLHFIHVCSVPQSRHIRTARRCGRPAPMSIESAAGTRGRPGMVMISPQIATTNSAPAESRTSRTLTV